MNIYTIIKPILFSLPAETAHNLAIWALKHKITPHYPPVNTHALQTSLWGLTFKNPIGLAAGFDKNGECIRGLSQLGLGFIEVGTSTPKPQPGNPKPRMFRLAEDKAIINRLGFNNKGIDSLINNVTQWHSTPAPYTPPIGINIGKNKSTTESIKDYEYCLHKTYNLADYITINISSPNTPGLRDLQKKEHFEIFARDIHTIATELTSQYNKKTPILIKIAPDMDISQMQHIGDTLLKYQFDGIIISNTTIKRPSTLTSKHQNEQGGLSGAPLYPISTPVIKKIYTHTEGKLPIIGVGGISSGHDAFEKIAAGASLVQLYSTLIYQGPSAIKTINQQLNTILTNHKIANIHQAIGINT